MSLDVGIPAPVVRSTAFPRPLLGRVTALWCAGAVLLVQDAVAVALLVVGVGLALVVAAGRVPARHVVLVRRVTGTAGVVLGLVGVVGVGQDLLAVAAGSGRATGTATDGWFLVAAVLFGGLALRVRR